MLSMENFSEWLLKELEKRNWSQSDLVKAAGVSRGTLSNIISGNRGIGEKSLTAIAHALKLPVDLVFEKAKLLPTKNELSPIKRKLMHLAEGLPDSDVEIAVALLEQREGVYKKNPSAKPAK